MCEINKWVPLNDRGQNANIKANILSDDEMYELGFTDHREGYWYFVRRVGGKRSDISFNITINKKTKDIQIDVLDEMFLQPYDFQMYIGTVPIANKVYDDVQDLMRHFMDKGIIYGYTLGDYI